jgi:hypothetical protein
VQVPSSTSAAAIAQKRLIEIAPANSDVRHRRRRTNIANERAEGIQREDESTHAW